MEETGDTVNDVQQLLLIHFNAVTADKKIATVELADEDTTAEHRAPSEKVDPIDIHSKDVSIKSDAASPIISVFYEMNQFNLTMKLRSVCQKRRACFLLLIP
jgi:hypothetical protein